MVFGAGADAVSRLKLIVICYNWSVVKFPPPVRNGLKEEIVIVASFGASGMFKDATSTSKVIVSGVDLVQIDYSSTCLYEFLLESVIAVLFAWVRNV
jgi:hypothetical protein